MSKIYKKYIELIRDFENFEETKIPLCAAETYTSSFSMQPLSTALEGKYSFPNNRIGGNSFIGGKYLIELNNMVSEICKELFKSNFTNAETITGINCITISIMTLFSSGNKLLVTTPNQGGHPSVISILNTLGIQYDEIPYSYTDFQIDYEKTNELLCRNRYQGIIFCQSDLLIPPDLSYLKIPENIIVLYDATQTLGMLDNIHLKNPLLYSGINNVVLIGGTHKTLPAPSCGLVMTNNKNLEKKLSDNITPIYLRHTQPNHIAGLLLALIEHEQYRDAYISSILKITSYLGKSLETKGFKVAKIDQNCYSNTHQLFLLMNKFDADYLFSKAHEYNITLNVKHKNLFQNDGIRLGVQQIAQYNWEDSEINNLAELLSLIADKKQNHKGEILSLRKQLVEKKHPIFTYDNFPIK